jgi:hypothetical protein
MIIVGPDEGWVPLEGKQYRYFVNLTETPQGFQAVSLTSPEVRAVGATQPEAMDAIRAALGDAVRAAAAGRGARPRSTTEAQVGMKCVVVRVD